VLPEQRDDAVEPGSRVVAEDGEHIRDDAVGLALERRLEQLVFAPELLVQAGPIQTGALLELRDRGCLVSPFRDTSRAASSARSWS
jgi:hypothetical protein